MILNHLVENINEQDRADVKDVLKSFVLHNTPVKHSQLNNDN